jgi:hypothetical protein
VFPLGLSSKGPGVILMFADLWPGLVSLKIVQDGLGIDPRAFTGTLLTTIVQGALLNVIVFIVMAVVYAFQRMFMTTPPEYSPKGFDVVMPTAAVPAVPAVPAQSARSAP